MVNMEMETNQMMENRSNFFQIFFGGLLICFVLFAGAYLIPWQGVDWGKLELLPARTITVVGEAITRERSQMATFTAGVTVVNDSKEVAIDEVNSKVTALIASVKNFGIQSDDIKTQNLSVYQDMETYYEEGREKTRPGQWRVSNSIEIKLHDVDRASALSDLLARSGATHVNGPNFSLEEGQSAEDNLLDEAINNAREKAEIIASSSEGKLGRIISVTEGYQSEPSYRYFGEAGGGGAPMEPGTAQVGKVVTVIFELK